ncbi:MAG TPA: SgcJ/EcaC family oxidoreductase [Gemmatimonadaceae bacterium]|nr:SgcJ/EcaC family oxidoreductase [Gemmatimonadaceae bacterium]
MVRARPFHLLIAVAAVACATTPRVNVASEEAAIRAINRQMEQAVASRNADAIARLYTTDAVFMVPNMPVARGQAAIREAWTGLLPANASLSLSPMKIDVASSGELATDVGTYTFTFAGDQGRPMTDRGKYMVQFRKVGTEWKIAHDIFNSDLPVQAPEPAPVTVVVLEPTGDEMTMNTAAGMTFQPLEVPGFKSGMQLAVLHGDPAGKGDYTIRLKFPAGYRFPAHFHPNAEHLTVLSGTFLLAMGEKEGGALREYQPGDFLYVPPRKPHYGGAKGETVIQLHGIGPFEIKLAGTTE